MDVNTALDEAWSCMDGDQHASRKCGEDDDAAALAQAMGVIKDLKGKVPLAKDQVAIVADLIGMRLDYIHDWRHQNDPDLTKEELKLEQLMEYLNQNQ